MVKNLFQLDTNSTLVITTFSSLNNLNICIVSKAKRLFLKPYNYLLISIYKYSNNNIKKDSSSNGDNTSDDNTEENSDDHGDESDENSPPATLSRSKL